MNVRKGFSRLARAAAYAYWAIAAVAAVFATRDAMRSYDAYSYTYTLHWDWLGNGIAEGALPTLLWGGSAFLVLYCIYMGARWVALGFLDKPAD